MKKEIFHQLINNLLLISTFQVTFANSDVNNKCTKDNKFLDINSTIISSQLNTILNSNDYNKINNQFGIVEADLKAIINRLIDEIEQRQKRAVPRQSNPNCVVSKRELSDSKSVIDNAMQHISQNNDNCVFTTTKNNNCNELIKLIQCGVSNIKNEYNKININAVSSKQYEKLNNAYEQLTNKYLKIKDDVKALNDERYKLQMDKLTADMQNLAQLLSDSKDTILKKTIELCAAQIQIGNIESSIKEYNNLMDVNNKILTLTQIVNNVYNNIKNSNKDDFINNLLNFVEKIPHTCEKFTTYLTVITKMQEHGHINCHLRNYWNHLKAASRKWNSQSLIGKVTECPENYMENFKTLLDGINRKIYAICIPNAENAINFIDELLTNDQKVIAYPILFEEMKKRNGLNGYEIVLLGYRIQEIMVMQKIENLSNIMKIKEELPSGVKVLMSAGAIRLQTKGLTNSNFALSYMVTAACRESVDQYQDWIIRVHQRGRYFQFLNAANAHSLRTDLTKTFVTTGFCARHLWEIIPIANGASFYIKNKFYHNILGVDVNSRLSDACYTVKVFPTYTGDNYLQWEIKHKI